jgi:hypothetical protein
MRVRHALTGAIYERRDDDLVEVELDGKRGVFRTDGRWVRGELRSADPHMLVWLSTTQPGSSTPEDEGGFTERSPF